jgi:iron complex transport system substrate-binding protein
MNQTTNNIRTSRKPRKATYICCATLVLGTVLGAEGCGTNSNQNSNSNTSSSSSNNQKTTSNFPLTVTDEAGHKVTIPKSPTHIASITQGTDEILSDLVPKNDIAMVTSWSSDPTQSNIVDFVKGIPQIQEANAEQIIAAHPDLVFLASYSKAGVIDQIKQAKIPTYEFDDFNSIQDIEKNIQIVGQLVGKEDKAKQMVDKMEEQLKQIKTAVQGEKRLTVLDYSSYGYTAGNGTTVNDIIVHAGATNAASQLKGWQKITDEQVVKLNPDVIIYPKSETGFATKLLNDKALQSVNAIKNRKLYGIQDADLSTVSQYITKAVADVAQALYPNVKLGQ